ncbi:MAG TPA: DUF6077 domain-containing protein [Blastocatellia bacterium]
MTNTISARYAGRMQVISPLLELSLSLFASWTIAYHIVLAGRLPAYCTIILCAPMGLVLSLVSLNQHRQQSGDGTNRISRGPAVALFLIALCAGLTAILVLRPDADDLTLFHRVLIQNWSQPFSTGDGVSNFPNLPAQSVLHIMTSYEPLIGLLAKVAHLNQLRAYHNVPPFVAAFFMVAIYFLLYRSLGLAEWTAVAATGLVVVFLLVDGNVHGSFGNMALDRLWQGKCIVWTVLVPGCLLGAYKFLNKPDSKSLLRLGLLGISAQGLSEVGVYSLPILILAIAIAWIFTSRDPIKRLRSAGLLCASMFYPIIVGLALLAGILHRPAAHGVWDAYPAIWYINLQYVIGADRFAFAVLRDLAALLLLPLIGLTGRPRLFVISLTVVLFVMITSPIAAPFWMKLLYRVSYWRLALLFPLPLSVGLLAPAISRLRALDLRPKIAAEAAIVFFLAMVVISFQHTASLPFGNSFKKPWELQFDEATAGFSRAITPFVHGTEILAPENVVCVLALLRPDLRFESSRPVNDPVKFGEAGLYDEARKRVDAQQFTDCIRNNATSRASREVIQDGVNTIILHRCPSMSDSELVAPLPGSWDVVFENDTYLVLIRQDSN